MTKFLALAFVLVSTPVVAADLPAVFSPASDPPRPLCITYIWDAWGNCVGAPLGSVGNDLQATRITDRSVRRPPTPDPDPPHCGPKGHDKGHHGKGNHGGGKRH